MELLDHDATRRWFLVVARAWNQAGDISHVAVRRWEDGDMGETYIATRKGWAK